MITFSESQQKIVDALETVNNAHWIDNHNGTISCSNCYTWFNRDDRYSYMHFCPNCGVCMKDCRTLDEFIEDSKESEEQEMTDNDYIAEYVKERHSGILGFDFAVWKMARKIIETAKAFGEVFKNIDTEDLQKMMEEREKENDK